MTPIVDTVRSGKEEVKQTPPGEIEHLKNLEQILSVLARIVMFAIPAFAFALSIHQIKGGWDDGAITAAFSRTLAETGRFALTPLSENVEGFSSVTWVFLLAIPYYIFHSTIAILVWMKFLSAVSFLISLFVVRRLAARLLGGSAQADVSTILVALVICPLAETLNGMEMNLYMLLVLCLVDVLSCEQRRPNRTIAIWVLVFAMISTRFESPFLLAALVVGLLFSSDREGACQVGASAVASFGIMQLWRYREFGVLMPNTVYAKMHVPYSPPHQLMPMLRSRGFAVEELAAVFGGPLLAILLVAAGVLFWKHLLPMFARLKQRTAMSVLLLAAFLFVANHILPGFVADTRRLHALVTVGFVILAIALVLGSYLRRRRAARLGWLTAALVSAALAFDFIFGQNWGYAGRMVLPCTPFLALATVDFMNRNIQSKHWRTIALVGCVLSQFLAWTPIVWRASTNDDPLSVSRIEHSGRIGDAIRKLSDLESVSILLPDVGGSSLCCEKLQILDSALLSNGYLAHNGYKAFDQYLHRQMPQIIETHGMWSELSGVYQSELMSDYNFVIIDRSRLLLRNDIYRRTCSRLKTMTDLHIGYGAQCLMGVGDEYRGMDADNEFAATRQSCLVITRDDLRQNGISLE